MLYKTRYNSGLFYTVLSEDFCAHKIMSVKFLQIFADDQGTFCIFFHLVLQFDCITTIWNVAIQQLECSIATEKSKSLAFEIL